MQWVQLGRMEYLEKGVKAEVMACMTPSLMIGSMQAGHNACKLDKMHPMRRRYLSLGNYLRVNGVCVKLRLVGQIWPKV